MVEEPSRPSGSVVRFFFSGAGTGAAASVRPGEDFLFVSRIGPSPGSGVVDGIMGDGMPASISITTGVFASAAGAFFFVSAMTGGCPPGVRRVRRKRTWP